MHRRFDPPSGQPSIAADIEQSSPNVVVVPDKVQAGLIDADNFVPPQSEPAIVEMDQTAQHADRRSITCRQDHGVERLFRVI